METLPGPRAVLSVLADVFQHTSRVAPARAVLGVGVIDPYHDLIHATVLHCYLTPSIRFTIKKDY